MSANGGSWRAARQHVAQVKAPARPWRSIRALVLAVLAAVEVPRDNDRGRPQSPGTPGPAARPRCLGVAAPAGRTILILARHGGALGACGLFFGLVDVRGDSA